MDIMHKCSCTMSSCTVFATYADVCSLDGGIKLHKVHDESPAVTLPVDGQGGKTCVHFSPLDVVLASSAEDGSLHTWDTATCQSEDSYNSLHKVIVCIDNRGKLRQAMPACYLFACLSSPTAM